MPLVECSWHYPSRLASTQQVRLQNNRKDCRKAILPSFCLSLSLLPDMELAKFCPAQSTLNKPASGRNSCSFRNFAHLFTYGRCFCGRYFWVVCPAETQAWSILRTKEKSKRASGKHTKRKSGYFLPFEISNEKSKFGRRALHMSS